MHKIKRFFENHKTVRIICFVMAIVMAVGALGALSTALHKKAVEPGVINPEGQVTGVEAYGERSADYAVLYEQKGLIACYVAYGSDSITDAGNGTYIWKNYVAGGKDAELYGSQYWRRMDGGIGYNMTFAQWGTPNMDDGDKTKVGCNIPYDLSSQNGVDSYHVESVLSYRGLTNEDGSQLILPFEDYPNGVNFSGKSIFRFGLLHGLGYVCKLSGLAFKNNWFVSDLSVGQIWSGKFVANRDYVEVNPIDYVPGRYYNKITLMSCSLIRNDTSYSITNSVAYGRLYDIQVSKVELTQNEYIVLENGQGVDLAENFSLLNGLPGTLYSVRYYDCEISQEARYRNFFVDLCGFYNINVSNFFKFSAEDLEAFLVNCGTQAHAKGVEMDADNYAANRTLVYQIINNNMKG